MRREVVRHVENESQLESVLKWAADMVRRGLPGGPVAVRIGRPTRTLDQNAKLWPCLSDVARQVPWMVDGEYTYLRPEEWKDLFTASLKRQRMIQGIDGGVVMIGQSTSRMDKQTFADLTELILAFGAERGVEWSNDSERVREEHVS